MRTPVRIPFSPALAALAVMVLAAAGCGDNLVGGGLFPDSGLIPDGGPQDGGEDPNPYPSGPYGRNEGEILANMVFAGYVNDGPGDGPVQATGYQQPVTLQDIRTTEGYRYLLLSVAADWCVECKIEAQSFPGQFDGWGPEGGYLMAVVIEDTATNVATKQTLDGWVAAFSPNYTTLHDPDGFINQELAPSTLPLNIVVDLQTMEILRARIGTDPAIFDYFGALLDP